MKMIFAILVLVSSALGAENLTVDTYDGMIHLEFSGDAAKTYFRSIKVKATDNGGALIKNLNESTSCAYFKESKTYRCNISQAQN